MLDVHPPHEPVHGWRDFLVHLLTITVGLLIALGLEAIAENIHHRHDVRETRAALQREREENRRRYAANTIHFRRQTATLENNLIVLAYVKDHPGVNQSDLPGILNWPDANARITESAWKTAQQTGVLAFMPQEEIRQEAEFYDFLERIQSAHDEKSSAMQEALRYAIHDPDPSHLNSADLKQEIEITGTVLLKHIQHGFLMEDLAVKFPEFEPAPTHEELLRPLHLENILSNPDLQRAIKLTKQRADTAAILPREVQGR